jgi:hypothetical protein
MEKVGSQVKLPLKRAVQISVQGIRIRLGRSLVTVSGVVLGIAFLMSNLTSQLIKGCLAHETELRQTVNMMENLVKGETGSLEGKTLGIAVFGALTEHEKALIAKLRAAGTKEIRCFGPSIEGLTPCGISTVSQDAALLLVLGDGAAASLSLADLTAGMTEKVVLDSVEKRAYSSALPPGVRREVFFGRESEERAVKLRAEAEANRFRTLWITIFSLLVTVIGIANALLMSVTERFREIGTMKCLGALSAFIRRLFLIESTIIGIAGAIVGTLLGVILPIVAYGATFGFAAVAGALVYGQLVAFGIFCIVVGTILSMIAAIYPANFASRMVPASALRSNV